MHSTACEKHALSFIDFLLTEILQTNTSSLPVKKNCLNTMSRFFYNSADKKKVLAACSKAQAQRVVRAAKKHSGLGEGVFLPAQAAERSLSSFTPKDLCRLEKRSSIEPTRPSSGLAPQNAFE